MLHPSAFAGELERLAAAVLAHVKTQTDDGCDPHLDAAAVVDSEFCFLVAVIDGCAGREKTRELRAASGEGANARTFRSGVHQEIVEALLNAHRYGPASPEVHAAAIIGVAELVAHEFVSVEGKAKRQTEAVTDGDLRGVAGGIHIRSET